ncbi:hypothetical protein R1sor_005124 [Riccia sorocarpa]|uniref:Uncharacterized protein n=1 Tax=Riccia sorocarpa TaxID=122646 RepID=A0ABD3HIM2_9MARC
MSASTSLQPLEDVTEDPSEGDKEDWDEEDFILPIEYFVEECKLPSHGIHPAELPKNLVSDEQLVSCFGPKAGKGGHNGHRWDLSKQIPHADILSLVQVMDGHDKTINGTIGVIFPRALYAERILGQNINWAAFAHDKLKNHIKAQKTRKLAKPTGPPCVRTLRVYTPPKSLKFDDNDVPETTPMLEVDAAEAKDKGKLTELQLKGMPAEKSEASGSASPTVCSELSGDPKSFGASPMKSVQIESIEVLKLEIKQQQEKKHSIEDSLSKARDKISALHKTAYNSKRIAEDCESTLTSEVSTRLDLTQRESKLNQRNKEIAMLLEPDDNFDENDSEMAHESQITFLGIFNISKCWGPSGGQLTYAGCGRALRDGRPCGLGIAARASRDQGSSSPSSQSSTPGLKSAA